MSKLTEKEIAQVFGLYPLCPVAIFDDQSDAKEYVPDELQGIVFIKPYHVISEHSKNDIEKIRLVLKPIHHITDTEALMLCRCYDNMPLATAGRLGWQIKREADRLKVCSKDFKYIIDFKSGAIALYRDNKPSMLGNMAMAMQWYLKNHFAIPLFFEPAHPHNGLTAIDLGIAIPSHDLLNELLAKACDEDKPLAALWRFNKKLLNIDLYDLKNLDEAIDELKNQICSK